jgi:hypothetical protein
LNFNDEHQSKKIVALNGPQDVATVEQLEDENLSIKEDLC